MLKLYNTLTHQKEIFQPIEAGKVRLYVCGMTVYDDCHIGHGRMLVVFDMITRFLRSKGLEVTYVRNITDVDDKIIKRAHEDKESIEVLTERYITRMHEDEKALLNLSPDQEPRATLHIKEMLDLIQQLLDKGRAYIAENGDVYFDVTKFSRYGELAHQDLEQLQAGIRVDVLDVKKNPADFVLWKLAKEGEPKWESPWGFGRPGWHIECSAMSMRCLGEHFDIHGGGIDLVFPHHQNEIAQSEGATDHRFVNYWLHNGHIQINQEKMSKSLGNFFTVRDILNQYEGETVRYFLLASHYRSPINYSDENLKNAYSALDRFYTAIRGLPCVQEGDVSLYEKAFLEAMNDDFNTPVALSVLFDLAREINRLRQNGDLEECAQKAMGLKRMAGILGLLQRAPEDFFKGQKDTEDTTKIEQLIAERKTARVEKNWARADQIREELMQLGVVIEDTENDTLWRKQ